ncbi:ketopantoate reductase family protein [Devriesea agamarum]|uniref:ketopantoate reductase family protein n=1 Tax=Devriesea agamarum TaxID=472569 RepID=UPI00071DED35|nr:2-dehydropantoate 2-reductase N-terminal domain-containing protein [Devriesea agamarum]
MRFAIIGAGTIGMTYGYLLSQFYQVTFVVRPSRMPFYRDEFWLHLLDLRVRRRVSARFTPRVCSSLEDLEADVVLVMVDGDHLCEVLPSLVSLPPDLPILFMLNRWTLIEDVENYLSQERFFLGFPSQVGGTRHDHELRATVFKTGTILEKGDQQRRPLLESIRTAFARAGLNVSRQSAMHTWLKVHCLQQSLTAAPLIEAGSLDALIANRLLMQSMVLAFREGLKVCQAVGEDPRWVWPAPLFQLPARTVTFVMRRMFADPVVKTMILAHAEHGLSEWVSGFRSIHSSAKAHRLKTPMLDHYEEVLRRCRL